MLLVSHASAPCVNEADTQIQFMKTRSSSGVGQKVDFAFDIAGLRIP